MTVTATVTFTAALCALSGPTTRKIAVAVSGGLDTGILLLVPVTGRGARSGRGRVSLKSAVGIVSRVA